MKTSELIVLARELKRLKISLPTLAIIQGAREGFPPGKVGMAAGHTSASVTGIMDRIEKMGFARRKIDPEDRRIWRMEVLEVGEITALKNAVTRAGGKSTREVVDG